MKIEYPYFWIIHAIYYASSEAKKSKFELTLQNNWPQDYNLDIKDKKQALLEAGKLSFVKVTEQRNEDKNIALLGATRYNIEVELQALKQHYKEVTDIWVQQLGEELSKKISEYSDAVKKRIISVSDLITESYEMTQITASPEKLDYLQIPIEKFTVNGIGYEDLRYAITCIWQSSRMVTKKHVPTNSLHIKPFPEYTLAEVISDIKKFQERLQGVDELDGILQKEILIAKSIPVGGQNGDQHRLIRDRWLNTKQILGSIQKLIQPLFGNYQKVTLQKNGLPTIQQNLFSSVLHTLHKQGIVSISPPRDLETEIVSATSSQFNVLDHGGSFYITDLQKFNLFHEKIIDAYNKIQTDGDLRFPESYPKANNSSVSRSQKIQRPIVECYPSGEDVYIKVPSSDKPLNFKGNLRKQIVLFFYDRRSDSDWYIPRQVADSINSRRVETAEVDRVRREIKSIIKRFQAHKGFEGLMMDQKRDKKFTEYRMR